LKGNEISIMDLLIFNNIENDPATAALNHKNTKSAMKHIIRFAETEAVTAYAGYEYVVSLLANDDNILSNIAMQNKIIGSGLYNSTLNDIEYIFENICPVFSAMTYFPSGNDTGFCLSYQNSIKELCSVKDPKEFLDRLINHYRNLGIGIKSKYIAFKYDGTLNGIGRTDKISFDSLIGIDYQKNILIENTKAFLKGRQANNVLLVGDRGTGKSSLVKALLNMFFKNGLRMVEMPKTVICSMQQLIEELSLSPHKYIIFLDDLTFESGEPDYRALKVAMEGQLREMPENILLYATSNRRHLIKETWADREGGEIHKNDQRQETMSLSERFGISLVFSAPNQREYLKIVSALLAKHSVEMNAEIERKALIWEMNYNGFSGRCAKQFVSSYLSEISEI